MEKIIFEVQKRLLKDDKLIIKQKTIKNIAKMMEENDITINEKSLYMNCIIDGLKELKKYNENI